jgi:phosphoglycolate phosphatase-like HAD superfamily hydrolase
MITAKAVIFDYDCTLVDTLKRFHDVFDQLLRERGDEPLGWDKFFKYYVADTLDDVITAPFNKERERKLHEFWLEFLRRYRADDPGSKLIPGVKEVFQKLNNAGVPIAVITSCIAPKAQIKEELASFELDKFVKAIVTGDDAIKDLNGHHFSKVEIFRLAAERLGVDLRGCVVVGDYWNDVRDGKVLGARTIAVLTGLMRRELLEKYGPDAIIESVRDLPKVVKFETQKL